MNKPDTIPGTRRNSRNTQRATARRKAMRAEPIQIDTRTQILKVAAALIADHGFEATTIRQISEGVGILPGSLYHHFHDKETILHDLIKPYSKTILENCRAVVRRNLPPDQTLVALVRTIVTEMARDPNLHRILSHEDSLFRQEGAFDYAWKHNQELHRIFHGVLQEGVRYGRFRRDVELAMSSTLAVKLIDATADWYIPDGRYTVDEVIDSLTDLLLNGISQVSLNLDFENLGQETIETIEIFSTDHRNCFDALPDRRSEILRIAARVFARNGFEATSIRQISEPAGILSASLYHHFDDKYQILHELVKPFGTRLVGAFQQIASLPGTPEDALFRLLVLSIGVLTRHPEFSLILHREDKLFRRDLRFAYAWSYGQDNVRVLYGLLQEGMRSHRFRSDIRIDLEIAMLSKLISASVHDRGLNDRYGVTSLATGQIKLMMHGLRGFEAHPETLPDRTSP